MAHDKRLQAGYATFDRAKTYPLDEAIKLVRANAKAKFDETVELSMNLGIDPRHADQMVRGLPSLPNGTGKTLRVAVFARGPKAEEARTAGADIVGAEDLAEKVQSGEFGFDRCIATPDMMALVGRLGKILGPRGLMPNPKLGTVTMDVKGAVGAAKSGQIEFRAEKAGHHPRRHRQGELRRREAGGEHPRAGRRGAEGEAHGRQGDLPAEGVPVVHDGTGDQARRGEPWPPPPDEIRPRVGRAGTVLRRRPDLSETARRHHDGNGPLGPRAGDGEAGCSRAMGPEASRGSGLQGRPPPWRGFPGQATVSPWWWHRGSPAPDSSGALGE